MCAQIILDVKSLETQQELVLNRFNENKELMAEVEEGMEENLKIAKQNIELLKKKNP